jgi:thiol:disulfide interchange protein
MMLLILLLVAFVTGQPANWFKDTKGVLIESPEALDTLMENNKDKFILVDFYMEQCYWCYQF